MEILYLRILDDMKLLNVGEKVVKYKKFLRLFLDDFVSLAPLIR